MNYALSPVIRSRAEPIELSESEYRAIARAKNGLIALIGIEQKFDLVLENYVEYEKELLNIALRQVVFRDLGYASFQEESLAIVRRLGNLLSTARLYIDQVKHDLSTLFGKDHEIVGAIKRKCSEEYDAALGFRLMETLRGMMQHRSISGINLKYATNADDDSTGRGVRTRVLPVFSVADLREGGIKASVHNEIAGGDTAAVTGHVRQYIDGIANLHYEFRRLTGAERVQWEQVFRAAHARGAETWPEGEMRASDLIAVDSGGAVQESSHIFLDPLNYLASLERKNAGPLRLARMYVSSATEENDA